MGPELADASDDGANYIDDRFGGHFSVQGNAFVAERLAEIWPRMVNTAPGRVVPGRVL